MPSEITPLSPLEEQLFQRWVRTNNFKDVDYPDSHYDYRGFWKSTQGAPHPPGSVEHFPDTFKQHGHPTFSDESQYATKFDPQGGVWVNRGGGDELIKRLPVLPYQPEVDPHAYRADVATFEKKKNDEYEHGFQSRLNAIKVEQARRLAAGEPPIPQDQLDHESRTNVTEYRTTQDQIQNAYSGKTLPQDLLGYLNGQHYGDIPLMQQLLHRNK